MVLCAYIALMIAIIIQFLKNPQKLKIHTLTHIHGSSLRNCDANKEQIKERFRFQVELQRHKSASIIIFLNNQPNFIKQLPLMTIDNYHFNIVKKFEFFHSANNALDFERKLQIFLISIYDIICRCEALSRSRKKTTL
jgi:hypothetical protein